MQRLSAALEQSPAAAELFTATAHPGAPASVTAVGPAAPVAAGAEAVFRVRVADANGNAIPGAEVAWRSVSGGGALSPAASAANAEGVAEVRLTTAGKVGVSRVEARAAGLAEPLELSVTTVPGAPARVVAVRGDRQGAAARRPVRVGPTVQVVDAHGNPVPGVTVRFAASAGGAVERAEATTDAGGVAACGRWTLGAAGANELTATVGGVEEPARLTATARR